MTDRSVVVTAAVVTTDEHHIARAIEGDHRVSTADRIAALYDDWHADPFDTCPPCQGALDHDDRDERVFMGRTWRHTVELRGVVTYEVHP